MGKDLKGKDLGKGFGQRKDGRYEARCMVNGQKLCLYGKNLTQLRKDFEKAKISITCNQTGNYAAMLLKDWFEEWFAEYKIPRLKNKESAKVYKRKVKNTYINELGLKPLRTISQSDVQKATNSLVEQGYKYRTIKEALSSFTQCMEAAMYNKAFIINPCQDIFVRKCDISPPKDIRFLEQWEIDLFFKALESSFYKEPFAIMMNTGLRIGEFGALRWEDIDFDRKCINVKRNLVVHYVDGVKTEKISTPKTLNGFRSIPFFDGVEELLLTWKKKQAEYRQQSGGKWITNDKFGDLVFTTTKGTTVNRYIAQHTLNKATRDMQLLEVTNAIDEGRNYRVVKSISPHALRHTFATLCFKNHLDPIFVQRIMGHASYKTTLHYTHILKITSEEEVKKFKNPLLNSKNMVFNIA